MPGEDFEPRVLNALTDAGGPIELAPQLVAIQRERGISESELLVWISYHRGDWSALDLGRWIDRLEISRAVLEDYRRQHGG
jgi:hypothetical protein